MRLRSAAVAAAVWVVLGAVTFACLAGTEAWKGKWLGTWRIQHDGWKGTLTIEDAKGDPFLNLPNLKLTYQGEDGQVFSGYGYVQALDYFQGPDVVDPVDASSPESAIGIKFCIDFSRTPGVTGDDSVFVGYLMGQARDRMAGSLRTPGYYRTFGWYAIKAGAPGTACW